MDVSVKAAAKAKAAGKPDALIKKVGIIGAGQMGNGIAHVIALAGYDVALNDLKKDAVGEGARHHPEEYDAPGVERHDQGRQMKAALKRIVYAPGLEALGDCDLVIEAATEEEALSARSLTISARNCAPTR